MFFHEGCVLRIFIYMNNVNIGKKFWCCRNYINQMEKGFIFLTGCDEIVDKRDLRMKGKIRKILS